MENKIYNDDVERVVNAKKEALEKFYCKRCEKRQQKMLMDAIVFAVFAAVMLLLGCLGWLQIFIASVLSGGCALYSAFCIGRLIENIKCMGVKK